MNDPKVEAIPSSRRLWPFAAVLLIALAWGGLAAYHAPQRPPWQKSLDKFRASGDGGTGEEPNTRMSDMIILKNSVQRSIMRGQPMRFSPVQTRQAIACLNGPVDELSQSEALDVLTMARRSGFLSPAQIREVTEVCVSVLARTPPPMVRLEGARFLSHSKDPKGIGALRLLRNDPAPKIREAALYSLAEGH